MQDQPIFKEASMCQILGKTSQLTGLPLYCVLHSEVRDKVWEAIEIATEDIVEYEESELKSVDEKAAELIIKVEKIKEEEALLDAVKAIEELNDNNVLDLVKYSLLKELDFEELLESTDRYLILAGLVEISKNRIWQRKIAEKVTIDCLMQFYQNNCDDDLFVEPVTTLIRTLSEYSAAYQKEVTRNMMFGVPGLSITMLGHQHHTNPKIKENVYSIYTTCSSSIISGVHSFLGSFKLDDDEDSDSDY